MLIAEAKLFHKIGLTPNQISAIGVLFAFLASYFYWAWDTNSFFLIAAPTFLLVSGIFDALDGVVARLYGESTIFGGFLDSLLDRYADASILVALIAGGLCDVFWGAMALVGSLLVSYARARAEAAGSKMETVGLVERAERIIIIAAASFASFFWSWLDALNWGVIILAVLTNLTVLQRGIHFYRTRDQKDI